MGHHDAAEPAFWSSLLGGDFVLAWYVNDDVWHEHQVLWKIGHSAVIMTVDGDLYLTRMFGDATSGPEKLLAVGRDRTLPPGVLEAVYRFTSYPSSDEHRRHLRAAYYLVVAEAEQRQLEMVAVDDVVNDHGVVVSINTYFGGQFLSNRAVGKQPPALPARIALADLGADAVPERSPRPVLPLLREVLAGGETASVIPSTPADCIWMVSELGQALPLGSQVAMCAGDLVFGSVGYHAHHGQPVAVAAILILEAGNYRDSRLRQIRDDLAAADPGLTPRGLPDSVDLRARLGFTAAPGEENTPVERVKDGSEKGDARTLWIDYDEQGSRFKDWRDVVRESQAYPFDGAPLEGPPSCLHLMRHWQRHGGNPRLWLDNWLRSKSIGKQERVAHELEVLLEAFYIGGTFDQLNLPALFVFEVLGRRVQSIIDAYSQDASRPLWNNAKYFSGVGSADDLVAPELRHFVSRKAKEEAEIENSRGRARTLGGGGSHDALAHGGLPFKGDGTSATPKAKGAKGIAKGGQGRGSGEAAPGSQ